MGYLKEPMALVKLIIHFVLTLMRDWPQFLETLLGLGPTVGVQSDMPCS